MGKFDLHCGTKYLVWLLMAGGLLLLPATPVVSQDVADAEASVTVEAPAESGAAVEATEGPEVETKAATSEDASAAPATPTNDSAAPAGEPSASEKAAATAEPPEQVIASPTANEAPATFPPIPPATGDTAAAKAGTATKSATPAGGTTSGSTSSGSADGQSTSLFDIVIRAAVVLALFILPVVVGNFLAKRWKMPDHAWKFSLLLFTIAVSALILTFGEFKFGPDLAGGITLVYELADAAPAQPDGQSASGADGQGSPVSAPPERNFTMDQLITALKERVDPTGIREVTIRAYGQAIEIIIPKQGQDELDYVKRRITDLGQLEFRITADPNFTEDRPKIEQAKLNPPAMKDVYLNGERVAEWVAYAEPEFGPIDQVDDRIVKRMAGDVPEALVLIDPLNVTGEYLTSSTKGVDQRGNPAVNFSFDSRGAAAFRLLTSRNKPNPSGAVRYLGIVLDKRLISAPQINETISNHGQISGGAMNNEEVEYIIGILNAGRLPAALDKTPISEEIISPTIGVVTVEKGKQAIAAAMVAVVLFMLVYYRFAGLVACLALTFNLVLVLALMVLIKGAFTLPGLAGLVLTIGMAVDANILIYERIREELKSGAALRMAIRNGFSRAMSAIIDSNVTTIISGIALYAIGTDQVKGFAVTLILGLLTSMFTAIFFARVAFDVAERRGWITKLRMMKILTNPNYDFLKVRWLAIAASLVVIAIGMFAAGMRGSQMFDIDFTGGSSVTFQLKSAEKMPIAAVHDALDQTELKGKNLLVVERENTQTRYSIDTSLQSVEQVQRIIQKTFGDKLLTYSVEIGELKPFTEGEFSGAEANLVFNSGAEYGEENGVSYDALRERLRGALAATGKADVQPAISSPFFRPGSSIRLKEWTVRLIGLEPDAARSVLEKLASDMEGTPLFPMANKIGGRVSSEMKTKALYAIIVSLLGVIAYLWLRFQKASYGLAAAIAVAHDVLVTIAMMAISAYVVSAVPALARALQLDAFQINLTIVAALLTIIGYSLNDTIVTFDRLREIKGKSPYLTADMVNMAVNQCLSRTILTALTVFLTVVILYFFGGEGIHSFAFAFLVGVLAGTYSTIYIAAPVLLWLSGQNIASATSENPRAMERAG